MSSQLSGMMPQIIMLALAAGVAMTLVVVALVAVLGAPRARMKKRIAAVVGTGPQISADIKGGRDHQMAGRKKQVAAKLKEAEEASQRRRGARLRQALVHAGLQITPRRFMLFAAGSGLFFVAMTWLSTGNLLLCLVALPIGLLGVPKMVLKFLIKRRRQKFTAYFADAIDVIVRGVRSGLTVGECLNIVSRELPPPVGPEFTLVNEGVKLGMTMAEVLQRMSDRLPTAEVRFFTIVLITQQSTGGNLAETLSKLSDVLRQRKRMRDKVTAMSSEAKASAAIIGSLPFILSGALAVLQPEIISLLFTTDIGNLWIGIGIVMMLIGSLVMRQMIQFDI
ncbi:type II secretion system F family protein [Dongia rigui]|uniref:Type II secretion system F family protein n=1 Tax=Dongia rigui TaxID=940149 RepID=A0ABU5DTX4_9PROT|nr:type II secretion system F family protein [Dongia rigui]MDY0870767.1 type II secretion system F family protein [Dongia rigui]